MSQYAFDAYVPQRQTNGLGIAGFVVALVGLLGTAGILCPIGLILSLIALGKPPRGFAIAGVIIGLIGTCGGLILVLVFGTLVLAFLGFGVLAAFIAMNDPQRVQVTLDMANIAQAAERYRAVNKVVPATLSELHLSADTLTDPWGNAYRYTFLNEKPGFDVISNGKDGQPNTADDIKLSKLEELWNNYIQVKGDKQGGRVTLKLGDKEVLVHGDDKGGRVTIDTGDQKINITGNDAGGEVTVTDDAGESLPETPVSPQPEQPLTPDPPAAPG